VNTQPTKDQIRAVACPQCSVRSGESCKVRNEEVGAFHAARIGAARLLIADRRETNITALRP
jgi:hypothetical protein